MAVFSAFFLHPRIPSSPKESPINMLRHSVILTVISVNLEFMVWRSLKCSQWEVIIPMKDNKCYKTNRWPLVKLAADTENVVWEYLSEEWQWFWNKQFSFKKTIHWLILCLWMGEPVRRHFTGVWRSEDHLYWWSFSSSLRVVFELSFKHFATCFLTYWVISLPSKMAF